MRLGPFTGIAAVILIVVSFALGGSTPDIGDPGPRVKLYYHQHDTRLAVALYLLILAGALLVFFAGSLRHSLAEVDFHGWLPQVAFAGGILSAVGFWTAASLSLALVDASDKRQVGGEAFNAMNAMSEDFFIPFVAGIGIMLIAAGLGTARTGIPLPAWLGWAGIVVGVAVFIPWVGFFAFMVAGLWIIAAALYLARGPAAAQPRSRQEQAQPV
ncbi:hypothetical protein ABZ848_10475 [Streptomyces sp. NPDC047081]|uniref:hypothetical protein n=1 Tax=Streptomyces sp. NPDC047081 TaxID=3154706 RepID=UPI0033D8AD90